MHFSTSVTYPASPQRVRTMWQEEDFHRERARAAGATSAQVTIHGEHTLTITVRADMPADMLPSKVRRFVGQSLHVTTVEVWEEPDDEGNCRGTLSLDIAGVPLRVAVSMQLLGRGGESLRTFDGDVTANIPLFSGAIEKAAVQNVDQVLQAEAAIAADYLNRE